MSHSARLGSRHSSSAAISSWNRPHFPKLPSKFVCGLLDKVDGALGASDLQHFIGLTAEALVGRKKGAQFLDETVAERVEILHLAEQPAFDQPGDHPVISAGLLLGSELMRLEDAEDPHVHDRADGQASFGQDQEVDRGFVFGERRGDEGKIQREPHSKRQELPDTESMAFRVVIDFDPRTGGRLDHRLAGELRTIEFMRELFERNHWSRNTEVTSSNFSSTASVPVSSFQ